ncbi:hypothetical protein [Prescottella equi]|uniref:hypothetical protein n=1 Tax=Rhodococcus hoagii TaxID=43767 RepID=UPI000A10F681|nr:hypothetical protein [Prescottella equi]ORM18330.1 hypothetical protein A5N74_12045 [Prescottella equi]
MGRKHRTVHIMEPYFKDKDGNHKEFSGDGFWRTLFDRVETLDIGDRAMDIYGVRYRGNTRKNVNPAARFLYVGKRRPQQDWPDTAKGDAEEMPLELDGDLVEPLYILPIQGTNYAAFTRSSGGPTFSAAAQWIDHVAGLPRDCEFALRPYVREDDLMRLRSSIGLAKLDLKFDPGAQLPPAGSGQGEVIDALHSLRESSGGAVSIALELSFGTAKPDPGTARSLAAQLDSLLGSTGLTRAKATAIRRDKDEALVRDYLDFIEDKVTFSVPVRGNEWEPQTPEVVLTAMSEGVDRFLKQLKEGTFE